MEPTKLFFSKTFIKNRSHGTIQAFKNYFAIVFCFQFSIISSIQTQVFNPFSKCYIFHRENRGYLVLAFKNLKLLFENMCENMYG